mgnify:CR=1 FL=1
MPNILCGKLGVLPWWRPLFRQFASADLDRAFELLQAVGLPEDYASRRCDALSGGQRQRVGIARAIVLNPKYLFCDEPNSGLDPKTSIVIDELIHEMTIEFDMTTIVVTHDMNSVLRIGETIMFVHNGKNWWSGNKKEILKSDNKELHDFVFASEFIKTVYK